MFLQFHLADIIPTRSLSNPYDYGSIGLGHGSFGRRLFWRKHFHPYTVVYCFVASIKYPFTFFLCSFPAVGYIC